MYIFKLFRKYLKPINISLLTFIVCNMFQYGFGLYYSHQNALDEQKGKGCVVSYIIIFLFLEKPGHVVVMCQPPKKP